MIPLPAMAAALLALAPPPAAEKAPRPARDPDADVIEHLDLLERMEMLQHLDLLTPPAPSPAPEESESPPGNSPPAPARTRDPEGKP